MITIKTAALTALAATTLLGTALSPAFAQRPYYGDQGYGRRDRGYDRSNNRNNDRDFGRNNDRDFGRNNDRDFGRNNDRGQLRWSGNVDDTAIITLRGRDVRTRTELGRGVTNISQQVNGQLPEQSGRVELRQVSGRGQVQIIEQPSPRNNYTARVRVRDSQGGSARYSFVLDWRPGPSFDK